MGRRPGDIAALEYNATPLSDRAGAYQAPNRAHNLRTTFTNEGITIVSRTELTPTWSFGLALEGFDAAQPAVTGNQVTYRYAAPADLALAYLNDKSGLHQQDHAG